MAHWLSRQPFPLVRVPEFTKVLWRKEGQERWLPNLSGKQSAVHRRPGAEAGPPTALLRSSADAASWPQWRPGWAAASTGTSAGSLQSPAPSWGRGPRASSEGLPLSSSSARTEVESPVTTKPRSARFAAKRRQSPASPDTRREGEAEGTVLRPCLVGKWRSFKWMAYHTKLFWENLSLEEF